MGKIIMMKGLPRSGKSTWATDFVKRSGNAVIVSRDDLRDMLFKDKKRAPRDEGIVMAVQKAAVEAALKKVQTVIIDDTNLGDFHKHRWQGVATEQDTTFEIQHIKESNILTLLGRDALSQKQRGAHVIIGMALQYKYISFAPDSVVLCDLDGTLCDVEHRRHHVTGENKNWNAFFDGCVDDPIREITEKLLETFHRQGKKIIFISARPERCRKDTEKWLSDHGFSLSYIQALRSNVGSEESVIPYEALLMRPDSDSRQDTLIKKEILDKYIDKSWVHKVIDDRPSVIRMWREEGLDVIDVGEGKEF